MSKTKLAYKLAEKRGLKKSEAIKIVNDIIDIIKDDVTKGEKIIIKGFGTFSLVEVKSRTVIPPTTKEPMKTKPYKTIKFKPLYKISY